MLPILGYLIIKSFRFFFCRKKRQAWNLFKNEPRKKESESNVGSKFIDTSIQWLKLLTIVFTALTVLIMAVISKGSLLFMTSQIKKNITRSYCNKYIGKYKHFNVYR